MDRRTEGGRTVDYWSYGLALLGIGQIVLTGKKKRIGWLLGLATSCLWVAFALTTKQYGFLVSSAVFGTIHIRNWIAWGKDK